MSMDSFHPHHVFSVTAYDHQYEPYYLFGNQDYLLNAEDEEKENENLQQHPLNLHADQKGWSVSPEKAASNKLRLYLMLRESIY